MNYRLTRKGESQVLYLYRLLSDLDNRVILDEINRTVHEDDCRNIIIDLSQLDYMDSNGLNLLLAMWRHLRQCGCPLMLTEPRPAVQRLLEMTRLRAIFDFVPSVDAALLVNR